MAKFKPMKARCRATFSAGELGEGVAHVERVDEENEILHGVQITLEGEAKGHGVFLDAEFCEAVAAAGNATGDVGLKVRYGHPAMCSDAIGTELARAKNFRVVDVQREVDGKKVACKGVLADIHLLKSAHAAPQGDIAAHVLAAAKEDPGQFGQSIVFTYADWVVKDADGVRHSYREEVEGLDASGNAIVGEDGKPKEKKTDKDWKAQSADGKEYAVLGKLHGTDFTDSPAATDAIFSETSLAEEASEMLETHPQIRDSILSSPKNVVEFLKRSDLFDAIAGEIETARIAGFQSMHDKKVAEFAKREKELLGQIESLQGELASSKDETSALSKKVEETAKELSAAQGELATTRERLASVEDAHRKLTAGALTVGNREGAATVSMSEFVKDHGGSLSRAVKEDPETYKQICAKLGCAPTALAYL